MKGAGRRHGTFQNWCVMAGAAVALVGSISQAQSNGFSPEDLYIRVVDVGNGLCTITLAPGGHVMVYDTGHWIGDHCHSAVHELVPAGSDIDLLVLSHSDSDHIGDTAAVLGGYRVKVILHTGNARTTTTWQRANEAIAQEVSEGASVINLGTMPVEPGTQFALGPTTATFITGWHEWTDSGPTPAERRNAISIVIRLEFQGRSVLFTGDTVGRRRHDNNSACKDAEKAMVENAAAVPLASDIMTAPHHGGNNGSSNCFIRAVNPQYVIFSAGRGHHHPSQTAADRYIANGVLVENLFRTDRGDHEGEPEWIHGAIEGCHDQPGDDDVELLINGTGEIRVKYRQESNGC